MAADGSAPAVRHLHVVGAGRAGLSLALLLHRTGAVGELVVSGRRPAPPDHLLFRGAPPPALYRGSLALEGAAPDVVLIAVPDRAVPGIARELAALPLAPGTAVLHTSGVLGSDVLAPLADLGCATGSLHPLAALPDPVLGADRLRGAWFALEGDSAAVAAGTRIVDAAGGRLLHVAPDGKAAYHAAAVTASNHVVALLHAAERLMAEAGVPATDARAALTELAAGAVSDVARAGPVAALTGPVARGDDATVRRHLERLSAPDRALYSVLARETLALAGRAGLPPASAERLGILLGGEA